MLALPSTAVCSEDQAQSAGSLARLTLEQLGDVEVTTASKEPEKVWNTAAAIYVLTQEDIRRSGTTSIPELLRLVPGVEVARIDSDHWSVGIRGFGSEFSKSVLVLIDGRSVYSPLFSGVYWNVQNVMLEDVDRIEVIRGPGGTIWGANAVNGVINIITKSATDTHGTLTSVSGGDVDQGMGAFRYGGGNGRDLDFRVYGMAFGRDGEFHPDHVRRRCIAARICDATLREASRPMRGPSWSCPLRVARQKATPTSRDLQRIFRGFAWVFPAPQNRQSHEADTSRREAEERRRWRSLATSLEHIRLGDVEDSRSPGTPRDSLLATLLVNLFGLGFDEGENLDTVLPTTRHTAQGLPRLKRENVLAWLDLFFGNSLLGKALENGRKITARLAVNCPLE